MSSSFLSIFLIYYIFLTNFHESYDLFQFLIAKPRPTVKSLVPGFYLCLRFSTFCVFRLSLRMSYLIFCIHNFLARSKGTVSFQPWRTSDRKHETFLESFSFSNDRFEGIEKICSSLILWVVVFGL